MNRTYIGIKRVLYGDPILSLEEGKSSFDAAALKKILDSVGSDGAKVKEVKNIHQDTWGYEESDPTVTEYIDQLTGLAYYRDVEQAGVPTVSFTLGKYAFEDKAALQGGKVIDGAWHRTEMLSPIAKLIIAQTKTGNWIVMPNANIVGKGNFVNKNIGLGVAAVPVETGVAGLSAEIWFSEEDLANSATDNTNLTD